MVALVVTAWIAYEFGYRDGRRMGETVGYIRGVGGMLSAQARHESAKLHHHQLPKGKRWWQW